MSFDSIKQLLGGSPTPPAQEDKAGLKPTAGTAAYPDPSLNPFTANAEQNVPKEVFSVPEALRPPVRRTQTAAPELKSAAENSTAAAGGSNPAAPQPPLQTEAGSFNLPPEPGLDPRAVQPEAKPAAAPGAGSELPPQMPDPSTAEREALERLQQENQQKIEAAQYQPFEVNYQSRSPNYDELAQERQDSVQEDALSGYNYREVVPFKLSAVLFVRQLIAAFFSHTSLSLLMPRLSMSFGPCYPGSMALPYLAAGAAAGGLSALICYGTTTEMLTGGFCLFFYVLMTGLTSFRGTAQLISLITHRRADDIISAAAVIFPSLLFIFMINVTFVRNEPFEGAIMFALASMLSASFASTLAFDLSQDPVDSFGTMSIKGVIVSAVLVIVVSALVLKPPVACSVLGLALLLRLILGHYYVKHNVLASRQTICAAQLIIMLALMFDLLLYGMNRNILSNQVYELLSAHHLITAALL